MRQGAQATQENEISADVSETSSPEKDAGVSTLTSDSSDAKAHPVDKGWAWVIMLASFGIHFLSIGYLRSFGILFVEFQNKFGSSSAMTSLISGVQCCSYSISTLFVVHVLMRRFSIRSICITGSIFEATGIALNGCVPDVPYLFITQGLIFGMGQALLYCPTMVILSEYFDKRRPIATVISTCGVSAGGMTFPPITRYLVGKFGLRGGLLLLAALVLQQAVFSSLFTPTSDYYFASFTKNKSLLELQSVAVTETDMNIKCGSKTAHQSEHHKTGLDEQLDQSGTIYVKLAPPSAALDYAKSRSLENTNLETQQPNSSQPLLDDIAIRFRTKSQDSGGNLAFDSQTRLSKSLMELRPTTTVLAMPERQANTGPRLMMKNNLRATPSSQLHAPSLRDTMMAALSTSTTDMLGSFHSAAHQIVPAVVPDSSLLRRRGTQTEPVNVTSKRKRWQCKIPALMKTVPFWIVAVFFAGGGIGSALPVIFTPPLANEKDLNEYASHYLMSSALTELAGRLIPGLILHLGWMRPSTVVIFPIIVCATFYQFTRFLNDFGSLLAFSITSGLFTGAFWAVQSLVVIEVFGIDQLGPALGFYSIVVGFSIGASYPISGSLRDITGSYATSFHYFGTMYYLAALMMILVQFTMTDIDTDTNDEEDDMASSDFSDDL